MKVFKFGGASVKDAKAVVNIVDILSHYNENIVVVISAMGKTTNLLEKLIKAYFEKDEHKTFDVYTEFKNFHNKIATQLFEPDTFPSKLLPLYEELEQKIRKNPSLDYNFEYDQIIGFGELASTIIVSQYLSVKQQQNQWIDIRNCLKTNNKFRDADINWKLTEKLCKETFNFENIQLYITQGFLGATSSNLTTTLGREGSDFTAAIIGNVLQAESVTIWKDVEGVLNADPKLMPEAINLPELSYREAAEMSHSGAKVIHPKTMKPLHNKNIPLFVKSFINPDTKGTLIHTINHKLDLEPVYIIKKNQVLITISPKDFSFIDIKDINRVMDLLLENRAKINIIQQSSIDFSLVIDQPEFDLKEAIEQLKQDYYFWYNDDLTLITLRHYTKEALNTIKKGKKIYLEQNSRRTARILHS